MGVVWVQVTAFIHFLLLITVRVGAWYPLVPYLLLLLLLLLCRKKRWFTLFNQQLEYHDTSAGGSRDMWKMKGAIKINTVTDVSNA
jgi:hypothetical protein